jgi:hypothetical protein
VDVEVVRSLSAVEWALLLGEAARTDPPHAALSNLQQGSVVGALRGAAFARYVQTGEASVEVDELGNELRAAAALARARNPSVSAAERKGLIERVKVLDALRGPVTHAVENWQG